MSNELIVPDAGSEKAMPQNHDGDGVFTGISRRSVSDKQEKILRRPMTLDELLIKPTGEVYIPHMTYRKILSDAFGVAGWGMRPLCDPLIKGDYVFHTYALYIAGRFVSSAMGECEYHPTNDRMSYGDALEGAKSNALSRLCKDLLIASECWNAEFCARFQRDHCEQYQDDKGKQRWRKRRPDDRATDHTLKALLAAATARHGEGAAAWAQRRMAELGITKGAMTNAQADLLRKELSDGRVD